MGERVKGLQEQLYRTKAHRQNQGGEEPGEGGGDG